MNEKISVIVPVYNTEQYLQRCLTSILENSYKNLEILCIDDGSTDGSAAVLEQFASRDARITVIRKENGGVSSARNRGLEAATGDYIAFVDSDDWVHPQYFEMVARSLQQKQYDAVICGFVRTEEMAEFRRYDPKNLSLQEWNLEGIFRNHAAKSFVWGRVYRKSLILAHRFQENVHFGEDAVFNAAVFCSREDLTVCHIPLPLYCYYHRPGSLGSRHTHDDVWLLAQIYFDCAQEASSHRVKRIYLTEAIKRALGARYVRSCIPKSRAIVHPCDVLVKTAVRQFASLPNTTPKEQLMYRTFAWIPLSYRVVRILDDPTLLKMERNLRKKGT